MKDTVEIPALLLCEAIGALMGARYSIIGLEESQKQFLDRLINDLEEVLK